MLIILFYWLICSLVFPNLLSLKKYCSKSNSKSEGFLAHELQEICNYAVIGEKDADSMQQVDYAKLTPILVKAIQELSTKVEALENA